jgi:hypothetical protein
MVAKGFRPVTSEANVFVTVFPLFPKRNGASKKGLTKLRSTDMPLDLSLPPPRSPSAGFTRAKILRPFIRPVSGEENFSQSFSPRLAGKKTSVKVFLLASRGRKLRSKFFSSPRGEENFSQSFSPRLAGKKTSAKVFLLASRGRKLQSKFFPSRSGGRKFDQMFFFRLPVNSFFEALLNVLRGIRVKALPCPVK